jgi:hypothetical protein
MKHLLPFIILLTLFSCDTKKPEAVKSFRTLISDTSVTHGEDFEINFSKRQSELLNLPVIFKGVDSFELRVWSFGFWTRTDLFTLRYSNKKWIAANYIYYDSENIIDSLHLITRQVSNDTATKIKNYLIQDSVLKLPSQIAIPNFRDNTADGETYYIEVATKEFYKQWRYHNPQYFDDLDNRQFIRLLNFLTSNFRIHYPY